MWLYRLLAIVGVMFGAQAAQADSLLALSGDDGLTLWDTSQTPPVAQFSGIKGGMAGTCYELSDNGRQLNVAANAAGCLSHLVKSGEIVTGGADTYDIVGVLAALDGPLNDYSQGFVLTQVKGIDYCGERENCDEIYVIGVTSSAVLQAFAQAVRSGQKVRLRGSGVWNLESIDIIIEDISPVR